MVAQNKGLSVHPQKNESDANTGIKRDMRQATGKQKLSIDRHKNIGERRGEQKPLPKKDVQDQHAPSHQAKRSPKGRFARGSGA